MDWRIPVAGSVLVGAAVGYLTEGTPCWVGIGVAVFGIGALLDRLIDTTLYDL